MSKTKIIIIASAIGLLLVIAIFFMLINGGSKKPGKAVPVTLNVWGVFESTENLQPIFEAYEKANQNVTIQYSLKNIDTYEADLLNALAAGTGPDVLLIHNDWLTKYKDKLTPVNENDWAVKDYKQAFVDVAASDFISENKIYAVPFSVDSLALYYNKDILGSAGIATPPKTWQELQQDVQKISKSNNDGYFERSGVAMGTTSNINRAADIVYLLMLQNQTVPYLSDFSRTTLDQSVSDASGNAHYPAAEATDYYTSFSNPSSDSYTWNTKSNYSLDAFSNGNLAFMYGYSYARATIMQKSPNLNFDVVPVPQPNLNQNLVNYANYWGYAVSKQSKSPEWAWDFLKFATSKDVLKPFLQATKEPASRKDLVQEQVNDLDIGVFASSNLTAKSFYKSDPDKTDKIILNMIDDVVLRGKDITDAISSATDQINFLLQSR
jgi:multiple sugar transport system substrate-binding protein